MIRRSWAWLVKTLHRDIVDGTERPRQLLPWPWNLLVVIVAAAVAVEVLRRWGGP